jgi:hypothetical protein
MRNSIRVELEAHVEALKSDGVLTQDNKEDWHFHAFNEDYYIIGYYEAEQWLKGHNISPFEAIEVLKCSGVGESRQVRANHWASLSFTLRHCNIFYCMGRSGESKLMFLYKGQYFNSIEELVIYIQIED